MNENDSAATDLISNFVDKFSSIDPTASIDECVPKLESIIKGMTLGYKFITIRDFSSIKYKVFYNMKETLGYSEDEFNLDAIYNSSNSPVKITHEDDLAHKIRYDIIIHKILTENYIVKSFEECYESTFRVYHKNGHIITLRKTTFIFEVNDNNTPKSHIAIWEVVSNSNFTGVCANIISKNNPTANRDFYNFNADILNIKLTDRQLDILELKADRKINKEIADILDIKGKTIESHISRLTKSLNGYCEDEKIDFFIYNTQDLLHFLKLYGLFPRPKIKRNSHTYSL